MGAAVHGPGWGSATSERFALRSSSLEIQAGVSGNNGQSPRFSLSHCGSLRLPSHVHRPGLAPSYFVRIRVWLPHQGRPASRTVLNSGRVTQRIDRDESRDATLRLCLPLPIEPDKEVQEPTQLAGAVTGTHPWTL
jgi:hypothetical protein